MAQVVQHMQGQVVHVIGVLEALAMMAQAAMSTVVRGGRNMTALVALRMMDPAGQHIQVPVAHAMQVPVVHAIRALGERAKIVRQYANDTNSMRGDCHLTTACRATRRKRRAPEAERYA